ncbi:hypothetical protein V1517DRAFT_331367 [Lipomyces orientalis]|uniref:Uncharacterized protein n=1 Tax=Lipomyces orientalis TaxID=1233043 RepID=A0ACC3TG02_9ASCO
MLSVCVAWILVTGLGVGEGRGLAPRKAEGDLYDLIKVSRVANGPRVGHGEAVLNSLAAGFPIEAVADLLPGLIPIYPIVLVKPGLIVRLSADRGADSLSSGSASGVPWILLCPKFRPLSSETKSGSTSFALKWFNDS